jgi:hypothetical protein
MAYEVPGNIVGSMSAAADLSGKQFYAVVTTSTGGVNVGGGRIFGILQNAPSSGEAATVMTDGISKVAAAGSTLAVGQAVGFGADGMAEAVGSTAPRAGVIVLGSSGSTGRILSVDLDRSYST